jgi:hypothetical protein
MLVGRKTRRESVLFGHAFVGQIRFWSSKTRMSDFDHRRAPNNERQGVSGDAVTYIALSYDPVANFILPAMYAAGRKARK